MSLKIYIACALTHVPRGDFKSYVEEIHTIAASLNKHTVKYALVNSDPQLAEIPADEKAKYCYIWDRKMVEEADLIIAEATFPSIGLGIELQIAEAKNIPIILLYRESDKERAQPVDYENPDKNKYHLQIGSGYVSLMALGLPNILKVIPYNKIDNCLIFIEDELAKLSKGDN